MSLPQIHGTGRILDDPDLKFGSSGVAIGKVRIAFNSRKKQPDGTWVDDKSCFLDATAFNQLAEHLAQSLQRGQEVNVSGRLVTESWETKEGEKRSKVALLIDSIGPNLAYATASVKKMERPGGQSDNGGSRQPAPAGTRTQQGGSDDPWASSGGFGGSEEPPFAP